MRFTKKQGNGEATENEGSPSNFVGSTRIRGVQRPPPRMANFTPSYLDLSTFLRPDLGIGGEGILTLEVLPHESALNHFVKLAN